jgi:galactonate dehydratase
MRMLTRRSLLRATLMGLTGAAALQRRAEAALKKMKITRVRMYESPAEINRPIFNQSHHIVTIETDAGITGIGEGGTPDLMMQMAQQLIGQDPTRIDHLWQLMYRGYFYPAGREKLHALGALDLALWDIKGKALDVPVWQLLGGQARDYVECYSTGFPRSGDGGTRDTAKACVAAGFRAFRTGVQDAGQDAGQPRAFNAKHMVHKTHEHCREIRAGVGPDGDWAIDYHTRLDFPDAVRLSTLLEPLEPYFVEDLVRSENPGVYKQLRPLVKVPIAVGEQFGDRWDINELVENRLIDYSRITIPNSGGLTEFWKHAAVCETHYVGIVPHFTGPLSEAACVHACTVYPGPALMEMTGAGPKEIPYLPKHFDFRQGRLYPNQRPGLGVEFDSTKVKMFFEATTHAQKITIFKRPDGSITNW